MIFRKKPRGTEYVHRLRFRSRLGIIRARDGLDCIYAENLVAQYGISVTSNIPDSPSVGMNDSITVSSAWELTSVSMHYSQGNGVHTPLSRLVLYPR